MNVVARNIQAWLVAATVALLSACGGGGGGNDAPSGSIGLSSGSLHFSANRNGPTPAPQDVSVTSFPGDGVAISPPEAAWLNAVVLGQNNAVRFSINTTNLPAGTYTTSVHFVAGTRNLDILAERDLPISYTVEDRLRTSTGILSFSTVAGAATAPADQNIVLSGSGIQWTATTAQTWIKVRTASGNGAGFFAVGIDATGLAAGNHSGSVTITDTLTGNQVSVPVSLMLTAPAFSLNTNIFTFTGINGAAMATQGATVTMNTGVPTNWTATVADAPWLTLNATSGTTPGTLTLGIDAATPALVSGDYRGSVTLHATVSGTAVTTTINIGLHLTPATLSLTGPANFEGINGSDLGHKTVAVGLNTGANTFPWTASTTSDATHTWLVADASSGNASTTTPGSLGLSINNADMTSGNYRGVLTVRATVNGDILTTELPVALALQPHYLAVADNGVAFTSLPTLARLSHTVMVADNAGLATPWLALANQPWLSVTQTGTTDGSLTLTADPTGLTTDTIHYATVMLASTDATIENSETVRVGFYIGSTGPSNVIVADTISGMVSDPVRPYVYVTHGSNEVTVRNIYSGALVQTISVSGASIGELTVASDGTTLYALNNGTGNIVPIALPAGVVGTEWGQPQLTAGFKMLAYTRTNGKALILTSNRRVINATTGQTSLGLFGATNLYSNVLIAPSADGSAAYVLDPYTSGYRDLVRFGMSYNVLTGAARGDETHVIHRQFNASDLATNADGSVVYTASGGEGQFPRFIYDGVTFAEGAALAGASYPNNVEIGPTGKLFAGRSTSDNPDIWIYSVGGSAAGTVDVANYLADRRVVVSGDALRVVTQSGTISGSNLTFTTVAP